MRAPVPPDESDRLRALRRLGILDTPGEVAFDRITRLAAKLLRAPMARISLIDENRQWSKSLVGLDIRETPRDTAFCGYAILDTEALIVTDALEDPRFRYSPLVAGPLGIRFYAGAPLRRSRGSALGTLCVFDTKQRPPLTVEEIETLTELASVVSEQMEQRLVTQQREAGLRIRELRSARYRKLYEALRRAQSIFIGGAEPDSFFGSLIEEIAAALQSGAAALAEVTGDNAAEQTMRVIAKFGDDQEFSSVMQRAATTRAPATGERILALPCMHGEDISGVFAFGGVQPSQPLDIMLDIEPFLISIAGLFDASRARRKGRQNARTILLRDRALSSINSAVSIVDPACLGGRIIYCNASFERISGYAAHELIGREFGVMYGPLTAPEAILAVYESFSEGRTLEITFINYHRDGSSFWNRLKLSPIRDESGAVECFVTVGDDVSDKIGAEIELRRARDAAEENAQAKSRFVANMSHEIRTPMNAVIGMTSLLMDTELTDEQRDYVETIRDSGEGLLGIINDILDFSKIDSGALQLEFIAFDLSACIESSIDLVAASAARRSLDLAYLIDPGLPPIIAGDITRLRQILTNLLGNAVKFTAAGSILLTVSGSRRDDRAWEIHFAVEDTGIGIPADKLEEIFNPFQQADTSSTRRFGGTGLGLAISRHLTELMGGRIWVESQPGRGSTFHFTIQAHSSGTPKNDILQPAALVGKRVLVIDPNVATQSVLRQHLESWDMRPSIYSSLTEARERQGTGNFDAAVLDNDIPGITLAAITELTGDVPLVVLCTLGRRAIGVASELRERPAARARIHSKPIKPSWLCESLSALFTGVAASVPQKPAPATPDPEFAGRLPYRILVAEDNPVNRKLALLLLARLGYHADVAHNGLEALRALEWQQYDVVFMDMHMPEMDGVEASRRIHETIPERERPWIVALTANVMKSDRDVCMRAGMDDFISKPIQAHDMRRALLNVARKPAPGASHVRAAGAAAGPPEAQVPPDAAPNTGGTRPSSRDSAAITCAGSSTTQVPPDAAPNTGGTRPSSRDSAAITRAGSLEDPGWSIPDYLAEMMTEEPELGADLLRLFLEDSSKSVAALKDAAANLDSAGAARILHSLKGSCAQMGGIAMASLCARMEHTGIVEDAAVADVAAHFEILRKAMEASLGQ
jgi:PAS domain S-box-containing protein